MQFVVKQHWQIVPINNSLEVVLSPFFLYDKESIQPHDTLNSWLHCKLLVSVIFLVPIPHLMNNYNYIEFEYGHENYYLL